MTVDIDFNCLQRFECTVSCKFYTEPVEVNALIYYPHFTDENVEAQRG